MKTLTQRLPILCLFILSLLLLTGCNAPFDRSGYVRGMLDSTYKGIHEQYAATTNETSEALEENYEAFIERESKVFLQFCGVNSENELPEDLHASVVHLMKELCQLTDYKVSDANHQGIVVVTISPLNTYNDVYRDVTKFNEKFKERNNNYEFTDYTDDEFQEAYLQPIIDIFRSHMKNPTYLDAVTLSIQVSQDYSGQYGISDEDITTIYNAMINYTITTASK